MATTPACRLLSKFAVPCRPPSVLRRGFSAAAVARSALAQRDAKESARTSTPGVSSSPVHPSRGASAKDLSAKPSQTEAKSFDEQYAFVAARVGAKPTARHPLLRGNALRRLLHLSTNGEQLAKIPELLENWRLAKRTVNDRTTLELMDRFIIHDPCALIPLFTDHPRYGLTIPSLPDARRILCALVTSIARRRRRRRSHPDSHAQQAPGASSTTTLAERTSAAEEALRAATSFAALYPLHKFPPATADLVSAAFLATACARVIVVGADADKAKASSAAPPEQLEGNNNAQGRELARGEKEDEGENATGSGSGSGSRIGGASPEQPQPDADGVLNVDILHSARQALLDISPRLLALLEQDATALRSRSQSLSPQPENCLPPRNITRRICGYTQSDAQEFEWVNRCLRSVIEGLELLGGGGDQKGGKGGRMVDAFGRALEERKAQEIQ